MLGERRMRTERRLGQTAHVDHERRKSDRRKTQLQAFLWGTQPARSVRR